MNHDDHQNGPYRDYHLNLGPKAAGSSAWQKAAILGTIAVVLFYLLTEHRAHFFGALPYLLLLACPLMHFFMHGNHAGHSQDDKKDKP